MLKPAMLTKTHAVWKAFLGKVYIIDSSALDVEYDNSRMLSGFATVTHISTFMISLVHLHHFDSFKTLVEFLCQRRVNAK